MQEVSTPPAGLGRLLDPGDGPGLVDGGGHPGTAGRGATVLLGDTAVRRNGPEVLAAAETDVMSRFRLERGDDLTRRRSEIALAPADRQGCFSIGLADDGGSQLAGVRPPRLGAGVVRRRPSFQALLARADARRRAGGDNQFLQAQSGQLGRHLTPSDGRSGVPEPAPRRRANPIVPVPFAPERLRSYQLAMD
jgi:hypothetical protein